MQQDVQQVSVRRAEGSVGGVSLFAAEVVARLVARDAVGDRELRESLIQRLMEAVADGGTAAFEELKPELKRARVSPAMLADVYIPEVARRLGEAWEADCVSFAQVTMGAARLQAILREIGTAWSADAGGDTGGPTLLFVLPSGEQHTLGAMVLAGRLRRGGLSVCLRIAPDARHLAALVSSRRFDAALISLASQDRLAVCQELVTTLKLVSEGKLPVVVGGAVLEFGGDGLKVPGADVVTNDIDHALRVVGIVRPGVTVL
ncbi:MAG: hypothetical protein RIR62_988 [Pseudomonadota bacterium]|jgi:methylmalonyl-CoA mutase cobalamin-binding subunit